ncbi:hypothetical protein IP88_11960 [alpha proteobacterium AAP81b]|nr:hypothetical protein IP88_11960 [alpha proteobacterium AAP81b]
MHSKRLTAAFDMASALHASQTRKSLGTPYLSHLLGVASLIIEHGGDEDHVIAGLLHDAVEDCGGLPVLDDIRREFGDVVADTVMECSDSVTVDAGAKLAWEDRKRTYIAAVAGKSARARFVTTCDKLHNAVSILNDHHLGAGDDGATVWDRFGGKSPAQTVAYYSAMVAALQGRVDAAVWQRLAVTVAALEDVVEDRREHGDWVDRLRLPASA